MRTNTESSGTIPANGTVLTRLCETQAESTEEELQFEVPKTQQLCGQSCPVMYGNPPKPCGKPCRGYAGHAPPHQCNRHHTW